LRDVRIKLFERGGVRLTAGAAASGVNQPVMSRSMKVLLDDTARMRATLTARNTGLRALLARCTDSHILIPLLSILVLGVIWSATFSLIKAARASAEATAAEKTLALLNTYEAQVVRALREIDQTLKLVKFEYESNAVSATLGQLQARQLLLPDLLFVVSVINRDGAIVASSHAADILLRPLEQGLSELHADDALWVDKPRQDPATGNLTLRFGRRFDAADGTFAGAALVTVDASYFVSGYDPAELGNRGMLALLGTDGVFRARRTGSVVTAGHLADYAHEVPGADREDASVQLAVNSWDGVRRYTGAQQLYEFPLAVLVGLSQDEQMAAAHSDIRRYVIRAIVGSGFVILLTALLARLSWQLARGRVRESEAALAHAQRVEYLAYHDGLTTLPNRSLFNKLLSQAISQAQRYNKQLAVAFIDLDRFKQINDTLGHEAGDQLLQEVAVRLKNCLRGSDIVARMGGDEFVVLLTEVAEEKYAATVAQKIIQAIAKPFYLLGQEFRVTASIGISIYPQDGGDEQTLTKNADIAMYQAKEDGKNNFQFYSDKLNANSLERLALEASLRHALERREFQLHYQAKRDIASGQITGMEALLRWRHPDLGMVAPMQFIPVAEETGLIVPIGLWVINTACLQNVAWQRQGLARVSVAVNLTKRQFFDEHLLRDIASILAATGMEARLLEIEIHESLLMHDIERTLTILRELKTMGVRLAIDDFGTGYSSLSTLQRFPLDTIKIDRSFIRDVASIRDDTSLTAAIISMGKSLSLTVVAQGVETKEQADYLRARSCDEFQGFYFNKPVSAQEFTELLQAQLVDTTYVGSRAALALQQADQNTKSTLALNKLTVLPG
jgi:diguanylate cyclase (GGDEF)-like protein